MCRRAQILLLLVASQLAAAQDFRAMLRGRVTDKTDAVIPSVSVTALKLDTGESYSTKTNSDGLYSLPMLLPGLYRVTAEAPGFSRTIRENVTLSVADQREVNFQLLVRVVTESVTVTENAEILETSSGSGGTVFDPEKTQNLPLNGRQVYMLLQLAEGVMFTQTEFGATGFSGTRGWDVNSSYTMNGGTVGSNQFLLNGAPISVNGMWQVAPSVDAVREFKVMTSTYDAQYGRTGGGTVNTTLKSGTNAFHGTLFDYLRNSRLDANNFQNNLVGAPRGKHITNQFGGTAGGPIARKRTFYFGSYEGFRERVPFPVISSAVPPYLRPGATGGIDFNTVGIKVYDPLTTFCNRTDATRACSQWWRQQFPGNIIPAARISPIGRAILNAYPLPNTPGCQGPNVTPASCPDQNNFFATGNTGKYRYNQYMVRGDHTFNEANRVYAVFTHQLGFEDRSNNGFPPPAERGQIVSERDNFNIVLDWTHVFSAKRVGDLRMSFGRFHQHFPEGDRDSGFTAQQLGIRMPVVPTSSVQTAPLIHVDRMSDIIGNNFSEYANNQFNIAPSVSQTSGRHALRYGGEMANIQYANPAVGRPNGEFTFDPGFTQRDPNSRQSDGNGVANLLLGYAGSGGLDWNGTMFERWRYFAGYIQDDFRATRTLSLNLGLRWDVQTSVQERYDRINAGFCFTCVNPLDALVNHAAYPSLPNPLRGGLLFAGKNRVSRGPYNTYLDQWQPRIGFAWAAPGKFVVRGGGGIYYSFADQHNTTTGFNQRTSYISSLDNGHTPNPNAPLSNPYPDGAAAPTGSSLGLASSLGNRVSFDLPSRRLPRVWQYSLGIQHQLPRKVLLDVKYSGSRTMRLAAATQWNTISEDQRARGQANPAFLDTFVPNPFYGLLDPTSNLGKLTTVRAWQLMRPFPEFDGVREFTNPAGRVRYDSLQVRAEKRIGTGMSFVLSYTWSKQFSQDHYLNGGGDGSSFQDDTLIRELASWDRTQNLAFSGVWNLPVGKARLVAHNASGLLGGAINNWALDWIFTRASGTPVAWPDADFSCETYTVPSPAIGAWFNNDTTCYRGRRTWTKRLVPDRFPWIRNPWEPQLALTLRKQFSITERTKLSARIEAFNALNTPIFPGPSTDYTRKPTVSSDGIWAGLGTIKLQQQNFPRNVQVSMKLLF